MITAHAGLSGQNLEDLKAERSEGDSLTAQTHASSQHLRRERFCRRAEAAWG